MWAVRGKIEDNKIIITYGANLSFMTEQQIADFIYQIPEDQEYRIVENYNPISPNPEPNTRYQSYYDLLDDTIKYDAYPVPLTPEELSEQRIASLEETIDTLILSALEV